MVDANGPSRALCSCGKPRLVDLFCCAGGASVGYARAGFCVRGVDIEVRADYPYGCDEMDALAWLLTADLSGVAAIAASPPCQASTSMSNRWRGAGGKADDHINLIPEVREALIATGLPYVIENVTGARKSLRAPIKLTGGMFGLRSERPRLFESNIPLTVLPDLGVVDGIGVYGKQADGRRLWTRKDGSIYYCAASVEEGSAALGIDWMSTWRDVAEAIPPAYTEHIGRQLLDHLAMAVAA